MTNNFISPYNLPFFSQLKTQREAMINSLVNNLKINDVRDDEKFAQTTTRIKHAVLIKKVVFGEPKCIDHEYEEKPLNIQQQLVGGFSKDHYIHQIEFPFTGDTELFNHTPEKGFSYLSSDRGLILPNYNKLTVYADLPELNPTKAIAEARGFLSMTTQFVNANNASIDNWEVSVTQRIDRQLQQKREELIKLFGD
ncbi:hypothetical protein [Parvicella tangerina]|uniref:Uncharacterized protein n=1 Tax=Parvicella tangerina TaxID=2829795 RepID=A0A916JNJ8_9FLAO|nr:hypothetical protein [Parvicella tangerina]CAG5082223.1 hypothetical protein CRYO30217_01845 [Parvicella tangerina]